MSALSAATLENGTQTLLSMLFKQQAIASSQYIANTNTSYIPSASYFLDQQTTGTACAMTSVENHMINMCVVNRIN